VSNLKTVTLQTDGLRDYVCLPDGVRYILGTVSVLKLVSALVTGNRMKRRALEEFNRTGQAVVTLDPDRLFELLAPRPLRKIASVSSFIPPHKQAPWVSKEGTQMSDIKILDTRIAHIENTIREMNSRVASGARLPSALHRNLRQAAMTLKDFGDQSKNDAFYNLGEPKVETLEDPGAWTPPADVTHPVGKSASSLKANSDKAEELLTKLAETSDKIESLKTAGRRFNASKAQADLHKLASDVHVLLNDADMAEAWVGNDLAKLARQVDRIHGLFAGAR